MKRGVCMGFLLVFFMIGVHGDEKKTGPCNISHGKQLIGAYHPQCDKEGFYKLLQCHGSIGSCWCSDKYGKKLFNIVNPPALTDDICDQPCFKKIRELTKDVSPLLFHGEPISQPSNLPVCDKNGFYLPKQSNGNGAWCVDKFGRKVSDTDENMACQ